MNSQTNERTEQQALPTQQAPKKIYEKPAIVYREPLEATAGACDPNVGGKARIATCPTLVRS